MRTITAEVRDSQTVNHEKNFEINMSEMFRDKRKNLLINKKQTKNRT